MKIRLPLFALLLGLAISPALFAEDASKGPPPGDKEPQTELGDKMEKINGAWRKLRAGAGDPAKNADSLKQVAIIKAGLVDAAHYEPERKADIPPAQQEKFVADYQAGLKAFVTEVDKLEAMLKDGKNEEAVAQVKVLGDLQKKDHKAFKKDHKKM